MRTAAAITVIGLVIGTLGAVWLTRFLAGLLYETEPLDVPTFVVMSALLFAIRQFASYLPARKAASVSPLRPGEASSRFEVSLQALQPVYGGV